MTLDTIMTREEKEAELELDWVPADYSKFGKVLTYKLVTKEKIVQKISRTHIL